MTPEQFRKRALAFPDASEEPHFEKTSFRVRKKIFATMSPEKAEVVLKLPPLDQAVFSDASGGAIYPVANKWGQQGWTVVPLKKVKASLLQDALTCAYRCVAPKTLGERVE
jgi:hypothetical protein